MPIIAYYVSQTNITLVQNTNGCPIQEQLGYKNPGKKGITSFSEDNIDRLEFR
jgi:hypothetical protein